MGIFFIKNILLAVAQLPYAIEMFKRESFQGSENFNLESFLVYLLEIFVYFLITYLLLFKTNWIIDKLRLDKNFHEETFNFNLHRSSILRIAIMILGGLIIIDALPIIFEQLTNYIQMKRDNVPGANINYVTLQSSKLLVGIFLISYQRVLVNFIEYKRRAN